MDLALSKCLVCAVIYSDKSSVLQSNPVAFMCQLSVYGREVFFVLMWPLVVSLCRSMNAYLVVYLCILISKALINTVLKYVWQADPNRDEPWYNDRTGAERQRHIVSLFIIIPQFKNQFFVPS